MTDEPERAAIYCRISRDAEGEGVGVERQEKDCRALAESMGVEVEVFTDNDIGASSKTDSKKIRHSYLRMIEAVKAGKFQYILAYSNSRLTRRMRELEDLIQLHENTGVQIKTVSSGQDDLSTSDGRMVARIKASVDAAESERISERQKAAFRHAAMQGKPKVMRQRAFGYEPDGITIRETEAKAVRAAVAKLKIGVSLTAIAREWEEMGILTASGGTAWEYTTVKNVCLGWKAAGIRTYQREPVRDAEGEMVRGIWDPLISVEDRQAALTMLENRGKKKIRQGKWMLSGLLACGACGRKLYGTLASGTRTIDTYACQSGDVAIHAWKLESTIQAALFTRFNQRMHRAAEESGIKTKSKPSSWENEERFEIIGSKIIELMDAFNSDQMPGSIVFPQVQKLEEEQNELRRERAEFYAQLSAEIDEITRSEHIWKLLGESVHITPLRDHTKEPEDSRYDEKIAALKNEVLRVVVKKSPGGKGAHTYEEFLKRLEVHWSDGSAQTLGKVSPSEKLKNDPVGHPK